MVTPAARRAAVSYFRESWKLSERMACCLACFSRSSYRRPSLREQKDGPLRERLVELAAERPRFGYRRLHVMLKREAWAINRKRVYRVYRELGLAVRRNGKIVLELLSSYHSRGGTVLLVTHGPEADQYADRIVHLDHGRLAAQPTPSSARE